MNQIVDKAENVKGAHNAFNSLGEFKTVLESSGVKKFFCNPENPCSIVTSNILIAKGDMVMKIIILLTTVINFICFSIGSAQSKPTDEQNFASQSNATMVKTKPSKIILKGRIVNFNKLKNFYDRKSYLQLLPKTSEISIQVATGESGDELVVSSNYPKISIAQDGTFLFETENLMPGEYLVIINPISKVFFKTGGDKAKNVVFLTKVRDGRIVKVPDDFINIIIPNDRKLPLTINLGEVFLPTISV